jgi:hypothetical protein
MMYGMRTATCVLIIATPIGVTGTAVADATAFESTIQVSGTGTDLLNGEIVHSK